jgi:very-short-patch-repair endonuclease
MPEPQVWLADDAGTIGRVDFLWRVPRVIGEADGRVRYRDNELWREKLRQERLEEAGFVVLRWTWAQAHAPDAAFRERVLQALARYNRSTTQSTQAARALTSSGSTAGNMPTRSPL